MGKQLGANIPVPEADSRRLKEMSRLVRIKPDEAETLFDYAYKLGWTKGREVCALEFGEAIGIAKEMARTSTGSVK